MRALVRFFHWMSFLQFPLILVAAWYFVRPVWDRAVSPVASVSGGLLWIGLALGFGSLAEVTPQIKLAEAARKRPSIFTFWLVMLFISVLMVFILSIYGLVARSGQERELWFSLLVLGIGMLGMLRMCLNLVETPS